MNNPENIYFNDVWVFDIRKVVDDNKTLEIKDAKWMKVQTKGEAPKGRKGHMAFYYEKNMIVWGGTNGIYDEKMNEIHILDTETWFWQTVNNTSNNLTSRSLFSVCQFEEHSILIFGGLENHSNRSLNEIVSLNLLDYQFDHPFVAGEYPSQRYGHECCLLKDDLGGEQIFVIGGMSSEFCTMDIHFLKRTDRKADQTWGRILEKNDFEDKIIKTANNYIFENIKYFTVLKDLSIEEKS